VFKRWLLLIVTAQLIGGSIGYAIRSHEPLVYVAKSEVVIWMDYQDAEIIQRIQNMKATSKAVSELPEPVLQETINHLNLDYTTDEMRGIVRIFQLYPDVGWFAIYVRHPDPQMAADIANQVAVEMEYLFPVFRLNGIELIQYQTLQALREPLRLELLSIDEEFSFAESQLETTRSERVRDYLAVRREMLIPKLMDIVSNYYGTREMQCRISQTCGVHLSLFGEVHVPTVPMKPEAAFQFGVFGAVIGLGFAISLIGITVRRQK
jgi:hypothetical protein